MIVLIGRSCSFKSSIANWVTNQMKDELVRIPEYTNRPKRNGGSSVDDGYVFINDPGYLCQSVRGLLIESGIETTNGIYRYGIHSNCLEMDNAFIVTNPSNMRQLLEIPSLKDKIKVIYLKVDSHTSLIRMLTRGDDIYEAFRRCIHDSGHFSGIERYCDYVVDANKSFIDVQNEIHAVLKMILKNKSSKGELDNDQSN